MMPLGEVSGILRERQWRVPTVWGDFVSIHRDAYKSGSSFASHRLFWLHQKRPSVLKNSLALFSDPRSRALNPDFVVFWTGFEAFCSGFGLPIGSTTTFSTGWSLLGN
jgi:hypothetical protein